MLKAYEDKTDLWHLEHSQTESQIDRYILEYFLFSEKNKIKDWVKVGVIEV